MPVDHETLTAFSGILDTKLSAQDTKRAQDFKDVHAAISGLKETTNAAFMASAVKVAEVKTSLEAHIKAADERFGRIDGGSAKTDGWLRVGAAAVLAGIIGWFSNHFGGKG